MIGNIIDKMEREYAHKKQYVSCSIFTRDEVAIINSDPLVFFKCTSTRVVLTKWIIEETENLVTTRSCKPIYIDTIYYHLRNHFRTSHFDKENLRELFGLDKILGFIDFATIRSRVLERYNRYCRSGTGFPSKDIHWKKSVHPTTAHTGCQTIKEAITIVLKTVDYPLTLDEIYEKIIERGLYAFGAQNPKNVVGVEIDRACENSSYGRIYEACFRFSRNREGKKLYYLSTSRLINGEIHIKNPVPLIDRNRDTSKQRALSEIPRIEQYEGNNSINNPFVSELIDHQHLSWTDNIIDLKEGIEGIRKILSLHFKTLFGYSNINILWSTAKNSMSMFLNDNAINTPGNLWFFLYHAFADKYVFDSPHIWEIKPDYPQNIIGIVVNLARQYGGVLTRDQMDSYFSKIGLNPPINSVVIRDGLLLFCSKRCFVLSEVVDLSDGRCVNIKAAIDKLFAIENVGYIILRDISGEWYSSLPNLGVTHWTALLLQEVLRVKPKLGYRVIPHGLSGQSLDTLGAVIVPDTSRITTFADVVHKFCHEKQALDVKMPTEGLRQMLNDAGMLEGNELLNNLHKALKDYRFSFTDQNKTVKILER